MFDVICLMESTIDIWSQPLSSWASSHARCITNFPRRLRWWLREILLNLGLLILRMIFKAECLKRWLAKNWVADITFVDLLRSRVCPPCSHDILWMLLGWAIGPNTRRLISWLIPCSLWAVTCHASHSFEVTYLLVRWLYVFRYFALFRIILTVA